MKIQEIINELKYFNETFPTQAIIEARKNKQEIVELLLDSLKYINNNAEKMYKENNNYYLHIYALFLLSEFREKRAFPIIIEILKKDEKILEYIFGDILTEDVNKFIASTFDGNMEMLCDFIENRKYDVYARGSALNSFHILLNQKVVTRKFLAQYIQKLLKTVTKDDIDFATGIAGFIADANFTEFLDSVKKLYAKGFIDPIMFGDYDDYLEEFNYPARDKEYITDTIKEMSWWYRCNQDNNNIDIYELFENKPVINLNKIGRNESCPCGSGRKYKQCCGK
ncbi:MAG: DUF1186 domain-containing protein [Bacilli bacterium]|nr:DUF1186 domain-containing protein [Bacilli bacterium]MDD4795229.1 DUF1186 domain-containing protein [Bacilli bacterium]